MPFYGYEDPSYDISDHYSGYESVTPEYTQEYVQEYATEYAAEPDYGYGSYQQEYAEPEYDAYEAALQDYGYTQAIRGYSQGHGMQSVIDNIVSKGTYSSDNKYLPGGSATI